MGEALTMARAIYLFLSIGLSLLVAVAAQSQTIPSNPLHIGERTQTIIDNFSLSLTVATTGSVEDTPIEVGSQRQIFVDDHLISSMHGLTRVFHSPERHRSNPLIVGDRPWEKWVIEVNGRSVVYDEEAREFRMYYVAPQIDPSAPYGERFKTCLAISRDGVHWKRPDLGQVEWEGSRHNNILKWGENWMRRANVIRDPADAEPDRRYKMTYVDFIDGRTAITKAYSRNGIEWRLNADGRPWFRQRHSSNLLGWDPRVGKYVLFPRISGGPNSIGRSTSADFITWSEPTSVLAPEPADGGNNFTAVAAFLYEGLYLGLLSVSAPHHQTRDAEFVVSRDGIVWRRVSPRNSYFPRGAPGTWDSDAIIPVAPVVYGDRIWIYYTGWNLPYSKTALARAHEGWFENGRRMQRAIGLATLRLDGFVSIHAGQQTGTLTTKVMKISGGSLLVNADVRGELRVEILDEKGQPIPGYSAADCSPIRSDDVRQAIRWTGKSSLDRLLGKPARLRFLLQDGDLYAFKFESVRGPIRTGRAAGHWNYDLHFVTSDTTARKWSKPHPTGVPAQTSWAADLGNGLLAATYVAREKTTPGVIVVLSHDGGKSWDLENQVMVWDAVGQEYLGVIHKPSYPASHNNIAFGKPNTVRLPSGDILSSWWCTQACVTHIRCARLTIV